MTQENTTGWSEFGITDTVILHHTFNPMKALCTAVSERMFSLRNSAKSITPNLFDIVPSPQYLSQDTIYRRIDDTIEENAKYFFNQFTFKENEYSRWTFRELIEKSAEILGQEPIIFEIDYTKSDPRLRYRKEWLTFKYDANWFMQRKTALDLLRFIDIAPRIQWKEFVIMSNKSSYAQDAMNTFNNSDILYDMQMTDYQIAVNGYTHLIAIEGYENNENVSIGFHGITRFYVSQEDINILYENHETENKPKPMMIAKLEMPLIDTQPIEEIGDLSLHEYKTFIADNEGTLLNVIPNTQFFSHGFTGNKIHCESRMKCHTFADMEPVYNFKGPATYAAD